MVITAQMVKDLRDATGAGPLDCKKALEASNGDVQKAIDYLRDSVSPARYTVGTRGLNLGDEQAKKRD